MKFTVLRNLRGEEFYWEGKPVGAVFRWLPNNIHDNLKNSRFLIKQVFNDLLPYC